MKRKLSIILAVVMMIGALAGCGSETTESAAPNSEPVTTANGLTKAPDGFPSQDFVLYTDSDPGTETYTLLSEFIKYVEKYAEVGVTIEAYEGSSGVLALNELMKSEPDGYSLLHQSLTLPLTIGFQTAPYTADQIQPVAGLFGDSLVVSVLPDSEFQSIEDIVNYAKANPGQFNWGGAKTKASIQVGSAMFWDDAGIDVNYIAYPSGTDALVAVLGGNTMCNASSVSGVYDYYKNGELKVLAVSSEERLDSMPEVPTFEELGYSGVTGYSIYRGTYVKAGVSEDHLKVLEQLHELISNDPDWISFLETYNKEVDYMGTDEFTEWYNGIVDFTAQMEF